MEEKRQTGKLIRGLGVTAATMIVAGSMIGSGIYRKPATMAGQLLSPEFLIGIWVLAGLITFIGALVNAEVACLFKSTGGQYVYFREMYGDFTAYLYGWSVLAVIQTGSQAAIAYVFAEYLGYFFPIDQIPNYLSIFAIYLPTPYLNAEYIGSFFSFLLVPDYLSNITVFMPFVGTIYPFAALGTKMVAIVCILFLTGVNYIGVVFGGIVQTIVTFIKIASIILLALVIVIFADGSFNNVYTGFTIPDALSNNFLPLIGLALSGAFWAYDGWNNVTYVAGEVKDAQRNVPRALLLGTLITMGVYILINVAYLYVLPINEMKDSPLVAASAADKIFGSTGAAIISISVIISTFGALNGSILATARVQFAMARKNQFFESLGRIHPRFSTPHISLLVQGIWSAVLVLSGSFDTITDYVIFAAWLFYMLGAYGVIILRKKMPDSPRIYKVWGYPYTPLLFVAFSFFFLLNSVISDTENVMMGLMLILMGLPIYFYRKYISKQTVIEDEE